MFTNFFQVRVPFFSGVLGAFLGFYLLLVVGNLALQLGLCRYFLVLVLFLPSFLLSCWVLSDLFVDLVFTLSLAMSTLICSLAFTDFSTVVTTAEKRLKRKRREG